MAEEEEEDDEEEEDEEDPSPPEETRTEQEIAETGSAGPAHVRLLEHGRPPFESNSGISMLTDQG